MEAANVVDGDALDGALEAVGRAAVGVRVAEEHAIGDEPRDRLGLIAPLREAREAVVLHARPVVGVQARAQDHVGGERERVLEALARHLQRELRAVAAAAEPEIRAELLEILGHLQRAARARALVEHVGRRRAEPGELGAVAVGARAEHEVDGDERRDLSPHGRDLDAVRQREANGPDGLEARQRPHGGGVRHVGWNDGGRKRLAHVAASASGTVGAPGSGIVRTTRRGFARTAANASRTVAGVAAS